MILKGEMFRTASGRPKQRGRGDRFWLEPESPDEAARLEAARKHGQPPSFSGSANRERGLRDLRNLARAIDPRFKEQVKAVHA